MTGTHGKFGVLVGVDGSPQAEVAIRWATHEAILRDKPLTLMHVVSPVEVGWSVRYLEAAFSESQETRAHEILDAAQKTVQASAGHKQPPTVRTRIEYANVAPALITASRDAFMTVVGSEGLNAVERVLLGSVSCGLIHHGHGLIAVIHGSETEDIGSKLPVLLGIDGSPASEEATAFAFEEASRRGVDLIAIHAWCDVGDFSILAANWPRYEDEGNELLAERLAGWQEQYPDVCIRRRIVADMPAHWLLQDSMHTQMVVVGSRGRRGFAGLQIGSVAAKVAQSAKVPAIIVRPR